MVVIGPNPEMISYSDTALTISETLQTNAIVWVHSLAEREMSPSRHILEDLEGLANTGGFPVFEYAVICRERGFRRPI